MDSKKKSSKVPSQEEILTGFQNLRIEQRNLASKLTEFETDANEHKMVIATLQNVNEDRKCFRLVGGVLTERTVKQVLPILTTNVEKLKEVIDKLKQQLATKGTEINEYREKHNISFRNFDAPGGQKSEEDTTPTNRGNVLVT